MKRQFIKFSHRLGFHIPRHVELKVIWLSALLLGTGLSLFGTFDIPGLLLALFFSFLVFPSYDAIKHTIRTKFTEIIWVPWLFMAIIGGFLLFFRPRWQLLLIMGLMALSFSFWGLLRWKILGQPVIELVIGAFGLTLLVSLIQIAALKSITDADLLRILATWWVLAGISVLAILQIQSRRFAHFFTSIPLNTWILFLVTLVPVFLFQILPIDFLLVLIEPTRDIYRQHFRSAGIFKGSHRKIGRKMTFKLMLFIILFLFISLAASL